MTFGRFSRWSFVVRNYCITHWPRYGLRTHLKFAMPPKNSVRLTSSIFRANQMEEITEKLKRVPLTSIGSYLCIFPGSYFLREDVCSTKKIYEIIARIKQNLRIHVWCLFRIDSVIIKVIFRNVRLNWIIYQLSVFIRVGLSLNWNRPIQKWNI